MNVQHVFRFHIKPELSNGFQKRQALDITNRTADFANDNIDTLPHFTDMALDFICYVRNNLNRSTQIITTPFFLNNIMINFPSGHVVHTAHFSLGEPFVMSQVKIRFRPIIRHKDFPMLERIHRSGIDVYIRVQF